MQTVRKDTQITDKVEWLTREYKSLTIKKDMKAADYIKEGNGKSITLTRDGVKLVESFLSKNGGGVAVSNLTGLSENTITKLKRGKGSPQSWDTLFALINSNLQPAA